MNAPTNATSLSLLSKVGDDAGPEELGAVTDQIYVKPPEDSINDVIDDFDTDDQEVSELALTKDAIDKIPMFLVLLILSPDYLIIYAYVLLVWQLHNFYFDGYATLLSMVRVQKEKGRCNVILISIVLISTQIVLTVLYSLRILKAYNLVLALTCINFTLPTITIVSVIYLKCKFSGVPKRDEYKTRLNKLEWAVVVWSFTRFIRAITSLWDVNLFFGMMLEMKIADIRSMTEPY